MTEAMSIDRQPTRLANGTLTIAADGTPVQTHPPLKRNGAPCDNGNSRHEGSTERDRKKGTA
jgi:hypothetical protein